MNGIEDDVRSVSSDNDNERVREKLKKTTIAPHSRPSSRLAGEDEVMDNTTQTSVPTRKRSHDESDGDDEGRTGRDGKQAHERKRSREVKDEDRKRVGSGLERVKTPPTCQEEDEAAEVLAERLASPGRGERKRALKELDDDAEDDKKSKISKTDEEKKRESASAEGEATSKVCHSTFIQYGLILYHIPTGSQSWRQYSPFPRIFTSTEPPLTPLPAP